MKSYSVILAMLLFSAIANAQIPDRDYLITNAGDTLYSKIKANMMGKIVYKSYRDSPSHIIDTMSFKAYHWSAKKPFNFVAVRLPGFNKNIYVGLLEKGKINLYERKVYSVRSSTSYWYAGKNGHILEIDNQKRLFGVDSQLIDNLKTLINDNSKVDSEFKHQKKYNIKVIRELIRAYNNT